MLTTTLCAVLSAVGLAVAFRTAYRSRYLRATRIAALALLPLGLALAGLVTLARRIGTAFGDWAADLVFDPTVWLGFAVLACSALLYGITRLIAARASVRKGAAQPPAGVPGASTARPAVQRGADSEIGLSDFADVEEILRRRGI
ncbi:hypothetical protein [Streptomyces sp.]|uniref:hypothetical protein n=1 Tax=Streptomyces sp. TaxID=1931 RepID=UPI002F40AEFD